MSEIDRGERRRPPQKNEADKLSPLEIEKHLDEIDRILMLLVEKGGELDGAMKVVLQQQLQAHLDALGVASAIDPKLLFLRMELGQRELHPPTPNNYPNLEDFSADLTKFLNNPPELPETTVSPTLLDVVARGYTDWSKVKTRGSKTLAEYLYDLGKILSDEYSYTKIFKDDPIQIETNGRIRNGQHRLLTLKVLGQFYVYQNDLANWVKVEIER